MRTLASNSSTGQQSTGVDITGSILYWGMMNSGYGNGYTYGSYVRQLSGLSAACIPSADQTVGNLPSVSLTACPQTTFVSPLTAQVPYALTNGIPSGISSRLSTGIPAGFSSNGFSNHLSNGYSCKDSIGTNDALKNRLTNSFNSNMPCHRTIVSGEMSAASLPSAASVSPLPCLTMPRVSAATCQTQLETLAQPIPALSTVPFQAQKWILPDNTGWPAAHLQYMAMYQIPRWEKTTKCVKCESCGITLNSEAQARQHFTGKAHFRKLKAMGKPIPPEMARKIAPKTPRHYKISNLSSVSEDSEGPNLATMTESSCSTSFTIQNENGYNLGYAAASIIHTESELDPVSKAVYDNMLDKLPKKRKTPFPCVTCQTTFNSESQAEAHFSGSRHAKRAKTGDVSEDNDERLECADKSDNSP